MVKCEINVTSTFDQETKVVEKVSYSIQSQDYDKQKPSGPKFFPIWFHILCHYGGYEQPSIQSSHVDTRCQAIQNKLKIRAISYYIQFW